MGLLVLLLLTAVISVQLVSVATSIVGGPPLSGETVGAIELSSCKLSGVPQPARCGVLEVPENPNRPAGRQLKIGVAVIPAVGGHTRRVSSDIRSPVIRIRACYRAGPQRQHTVGSWSSCRVVSLEAL